METTVVISSYYGSKYIGEAIQSILDQTYKSWLIMIVDDSNGQDKGINKYADHSKNIVITRRDDIGLSACRMWGAYLTAGKYLLFLDADDKLHPTFLEKTVELLEDFEEISVAYTDTQHFDGANTFWEQPEYNFNALLGGNFMCSCSLIRRKDFEAVGGFDLDNFNYWEDYELWINMGSKGYYAKHIPEKLFYYRIRKDSGMQSKRNGALGALYKSYIINKFPEIYPRDWGEKAKKTLDQFPHDIMKWKPKEQDEYLKQRGII